MTYVGAELLRHVAGILHANLSAMCRRSKAATASHARGMATSFKLRVEPREDVGERVGGAEPVFGVGVEAEGGVVVLGGDEGRVQGFDGRAREVVVADGEKERALVELARTGGSESAVPPPREWPTSSTRVGSMG